MCGIAGWIGRGDHSETLSTVRQASERLAHRGPDDHGVVVFSADESFSEDGRGRRLALPPNPPSASTVIFAARRLAILDLSAAGHQPMVSDDGHVSVALNGEIYNYIELREELEGLGRRFRSTSDTEVLLQAFSEWGENCLGRLRGMFAFVAYDRRSGLVLAARDRFGMKPLFFTRFRDGWFFASEVDAVLEPTGASRAENPAAILDYLVHGVVGGTTRTVFQELTEVPPAHALRVEPSTSTLDPTPYWETPAVEVDVSFSEAITHVREALVESVELHLRSDVPVGVMLSGGLDSSSLAVAMREIAGRALDLHTFSYIGHDGAFSEEPWIDDVNAAIGAIPHKISIDRGRWLDRGDRVRRHGGPCGSLAIFAQGELYRSAHEAGVTVVLSGQGGDEVFAGYAGHALTMLRSLVRRGQLVRATKLAGGLAGTGVGRAATTKHAIAALLPGSLAAWARRRATPWISTPYLDRHGAELRVPPFLSDARSVQRTLARERQRHLPILLRYEDRNSMMHSVEGRLPFLTAPLVELAASLPPEHLIGPGTGKHVLREAMRGLVPESVLDRTERVGFAVPHRAWAASEPATVELFQRGLELPPVAGQALIPTLDRVRAGRATPRDLFLFWRIVGLAEWSDGLEVEWS